MGVNSLTRDTLANTVKYNTALAGNDTADVALSSDFLIQEVVLNGTATSVTFDVSTMAAQGFKHLQIRIVGRTTIGYTTESTVLRFNNDTGTNYSEHVLYGSGSSVASEGSANGTFASLGPVAGASATANNFGSVIADLLDVFSTTKYKTTRSLSGVATTWIQFRSGSWRSTSAVTSITVFPATSSNFVTGSRFSLYGSKG